MTSFHALLLLAAAQPGASPAVYTIQPDWEGRSALVTLEVPEPQASFTIPSWREGDYQLFQYHQAVADVKFFKDGKEVPGAKREGGQWSIPSGATKVTYSALPSAGNFSPNLRVREGEMWVSGPVFGWMGDPKRPVRVQVAGGPEMQLHSSRPVIKEEEVFSFDAPTHQILMDSPFLLSSKAKVARFEVAGKPHEFVAFGDTRGVQVEAFGALSEKIVKETYRLFGSLPYEKYVFFGDFRGGYGGLEHRSSTRLGLGSSLPEAGASLIAHEYFHAYNVKAVIPQEFVSFDFTQPTVTDSLWWLEGVTDYFADLILVRAGIWTKSQAVNAMSRVVWVHEQGAARRSVTLKDSSRKVWQNRGSSGFGGLSYYQKGKLAGFLLDLSLRSESQGEKSLDDVMTTLFREAGPGRGYSPTRLRELVAEMGGDQTAALYDLVTDSTKDFPYDTILKPFGMRLHQLSLQPEPEATEAQKKMWEAWPFSLSPGTKRASH